MADYTTSSFIILVDDDAGDCMLFQDAVEQLDKNLSLEICTNGFELMKYLNQKNKPLPDIIFLDINMPFKSGYDCLDEIRSDERLKHLCVIIYSTSSRLENIQTAFEKGASLYFSKSSTFQELIDRLKKIFTMNLSAYNLENRQEKFVLADEAGF